MSALDDVPATPQTMLPSSPSPLQTLRTLFGDVPGATDDVLLRVLALNANDVQAACEYILALSDAGIPLDDLEPDDTDVEGHRSADVSSGPLNSSQRSHPGMFVDLSDPVRAQQVIDGLKEIVVPALQHQLSGLVFPDLTGETGRCSYALCGMRLNEFNIDMPNVHVKVNQRSAIDILAEDLSVSLAVADWSYRVKMTPLRDTGAATASFAGVKAAVGMRVHETDGTLILTDCVCKIEGAVSFRANNSRIPSWIYNLLGAVLRTVFRHSLETTLTDAIRHGLQEQLREWSTWGAQ